MTSSELDTSIKAKRSAIRNQVQSWFSNHARAYPWRDEGRTPFQILVAEILLKRTTATAASRVYDEFLYRYPSVYGMASANEESLVEALGNLGLQRQRARAIRRLSQHLIKYEHGIVPNTLDRLLAVPGLGEYSARAILSFGFGTRAAVVDNNVARILQRVFRADLPQTPSQALLQSIADAIIPPRSHQRANFAMLDFGALVCRYHSPRCLDCPLRKICDYSKRDNWSSEERPSRLRQFRLNKGLSLVALSRTTGLSKLTIINIEANKTRPRLDTLKKLAIALGVSTTDLNDHTNGTPGLRAYTRPSEQLNKVAEP